MPRPVGDAESGSRIIDPARFRRDAGRSAPVGRCVAGALSEEEFRGHLDDAGFESIEIRETYRVHPQPPGRLAALIRAG
jgi:hypothetical protein